jgi:hypothetical protein
MKNDKYETTCSHSGKSVSATDPIGAGLVIRCQHSTFQGRYLCKDTMDKCVSAPELQDQYRANNSRK